jgi:hypothetical protein
VVLSGPGTLSGSLDAPAAARYEIWLEMSVGRQLTVKVDGHTVASRSYDANEPQQFAHFGSVQIGAGRHTVQIVRGGGDLHPGNGAANALGRVVFSSPQSMARQVTMLPPARWRQLCGRRLDWIEVVRTAH